MNLYSIVCRFESVTYFTVLGSLFSLPFGSLNYPFNPYLRRLSNKQTLIQPIGAPLPTVLITP